MKTVFYVIAILSVLFLQSCSAVRPMIDLSVSSDTRAFEFLQERSGSVTRLKAEININPSDIAAPSIDAFLSFEKGGVFRLVGLSPVGTVLFDIKLEDGIVTGTIDNFPAKEVFAPDMLMELIDFYGSDNSGEHTWFMEEANNYYVVNLLATSGRFSYPLRRWWIDKTEMLIVKKELYSNLPDKKGVRLFEALYRDFKDINGIMTPFEIIIKNSAGNKIGTVRFKKMAYNDGIQ